MDKEAARKRTVKVNAPILGPADFEAITSSQVQRELSKVPDSDLRKVLLKLLDGMDKSHYNALQQSIKGYGAFLKKRSNTVRSAAKGSTLKGALTPKYKAPSYTKSKRESVSAGNFFAKKKVTSTPKLRPGLFSRVKSKVRNWWTS